MGVVRRLVVVAIVVPLSLMAVPAHGQSGIPGLPSSFVQASSGADGGTVWVGRIPDTEARWDLRNSAVYLPPGYRPDRRYPVVYLLHGMRGSPSSFYVGLRLADVADAAISSGAVPPFVAVMPVAGPVVDPDSGEWAGVWEDYVVHDVVPWVDAHLPTVAAPQGRALAGLCAGGFGAVDIGLRHPGIFGTLESWQGYFAPVFRDGPFARASLAALAAHTPALLVRRDAATLRGAGVRFYLSVGGNHGAVLRRWTLGFAGELSALGLQHRLWLLPPEQRGHFWSATLPSALAYAGAGFATHATGP
jgi:enterochelin esterase-like enzyme